MTSIFEYIVDNLQGDVDENNFYPLPEGFSLSSFRNQDDKQGSKSKINWADGALDGVCLYHASNRLSAMQKEKVHDIARAFLQTPQEEWEMIEEVINRYLGNNGRALIAIDDFQDYLEKNQDSDSQVRAQVNAVQIMVYSQNIEAIKFALAVCELFETGNRIEKYSKIIYTLGLCDEFAFYTLYNLKYWDNSNELIFELAKKLHGWGRIHAVKMLKPEDNDEMKEWLWLEGWKNNVMPEYSAYECYTKSGAKEIFETKGTEHDLYQGLSEEKVKAIEEMREFCNNPNGPMPNYQV